MIDTVCVPLGHRSYDVVIGQGLLDQAGARIDPLLDQSTVAVVTDENVAALHLEQLRAGLAAAGVSMTSLCLPAGESTKSWEQFSSTVDWLLEQKIERGGMVIAFGGG